MLNTAHDQAINFTQLIHIIERNRASDSGIPKPLQVVVGSFAADGRKESKTDIKMEPPSAGPRFAAASGPNGVSSPPSHGTLSESSGGQGSPLNQSTGAGNNNNPQGMSSMSWK